MISFSVVTFDQVLLICCNNSVLNLYFFFSIKLINFSRMAISVQEILYIRKIWLNVDTSAYMYLPLRGKRFTVCTEITIILGTVRFTIHGGRLRYKRYDAHFLKKNSVELPFSSFGDHLINILRKVNRLIYAFKIN